MLVGEGGRQGTNIGGDGGWPNGGYGTKGDASGPGGGGLTGSAGGSGIVIIAYPT